MQLPLGFRAAGVYCGLKRDTSKLDLALFVSDRPCAAAGTYTQNLVFAAPVALDRARTPGTGIRAVVINSGNANACTGEQGLQDAFQMGALAAAVCGAEAEQALVMSTGIIGEFLKLDKVAAGIQAAAGKLDDDEQSLEAAARAMMTTDTVPKIAGRTLSLGGISTRITGVAKGAAMIGPKMGTMLALVMTDAALEPQTAQKALSAVIEETFNCVSVDGHMSTNDTVLLVANGAAGGKLLEGADAEAFQQALLEVCAEFARAIPADGEGATHLITIDVSGCQSREAARQLAKSVADSPLVKCAVAGADPNWGRIVSAAGYAGVPFDPLGVELHVNGFLLYRAGQPVPFDAEVVSTSISSQRETSVDLRFSEGSSKIRYWTTDLTAEYVHLNADYHT